MRDRVASGVAAVVLVASLGTGVLGAPLRHSQAAIGRTAAAAWPTPQEETFQGCPPQGDGGDGQLNIRKNRIDSGTWQAASLSSLLALTWPRTVERAPRSTWSASDAASVAVNEGRPVVTEGYLLYVRHEGTESPNCHDPNERDYHAWLAAAPGTLADRSHSMIVELTPRVVARNAGWGVLGLPTTLVYPSLMLLSGIASTQLALWITSPNDPLRPTLAQPTWGCIRSSAASAGTAGYIDAMVRCCLASSFIGLQCAAPIW